MKNVIKVSGLTKRYGDFVAVNHVSFEVEQGSLLGFLGVNGAGKTTVINMLATLLTPDEGKVQICDYELGKKDDMIRRNIGIVYQQNCLDDILTVEENLMCQGILHGATKKEAKEQCKHLCEVLKLRDILKKKYKMLSGGQKRRCEIAAALMHAPQILFLDEPTTGLDPATRKDVWNTVRYLQESQKMTVFLTTHYMEEAAQADQIIILDHGNIKTTGTPFELKEKYATDRLKLYYKEENEKKLEERVLNVMKQKELNGNIKKCESEYMELALHKTMDSVGILNEIKELIDGYEMIQGNLDDVFLNVVESDGNRKEEMR